MASEHRSKARILCSLAWLVLAAFVLSSVGCVKTEDGESFTNTVNMRMIKLTTGYYVSKYETTARQYNRIMGKPEPPPKDGDTAACSMTGDEALEFCRRLTRQEETSGTLPNGYAYDLPSFDEWLEFVADAPLKGSVTPVGGRGGDNPRGPLPVGSGESNRLGIYDTRGNVSEYSRDRYKYTGGLIVLGADWNEYRKDFLRPRNKGHYAGPDVRSATTGFRCVLRHVPSEKSIGR